MLQGTSGDILVSVAGAQPQIRWGLCTSLKDNSGTPVFDDNGVLQELAVPPGSQILASIDLGAQPPPGMYLSVWTNRSTSSGPSATVDTMLFVGTSCPTDALFENLGCLGANDDSKNPAISESDPACCSTTSNVTLSTSGLNASTLYVLVSIKELLTGPTPPPSYQFRLGWLVWAYPSSSPTASLTVGVSASQTATPDTATQTSSATSSPSRTPVVNPLNAFQTMGTVIVLRAGDGTAVERGVALPLFLEEVDTVNPGPLGGNTSVQTIALSTVRRDAQPGLSLCIA